MAEISDRPAKKIRLLSDDEASDQEIQINEEYAKRFEHNKKREERHRLEEKFKKNGGLSDSDSTSEEEDDEGDLVTNDLDNEINATLNAIKNKDPRIYDKNINFYTPEDPDAAPIVKKQTKPMYIKDYHRQNLLSGNLDQDGNDDVKPSYVSEQADLKEQFTTGIENDGDSDSDGFLKKKDRAVHDDIKINPTRKVKIEKVDVKKADEDPETFLSNFMAARAWVPDQNSRFAHLDSDDSADENRAEDFESAYNLRFENPEGANATLVGYARDNLALSARREEKTARQRQREKEREVKDGMAKDRKDEKARLRRLRVEEMEKKIEMIKEAAGLGPGDVVNVDEWKNVLEDEFDDEQWEQEMQNRFGDKYYAREDNMAEDVDDDEKSSKKKAKKPKWDDDIDINDLVPDFEVEDVQTKPEFTLSDDDNDSNDDMDVDVKVEDKKKSRKELQAEKKRATRIQRAAIESLVDNDPSMSTDLAPKQTTFRYRETSPVNFGLSAKDILFADDSQLNNFVGIKKMHAFRDAEKKSKDKKKLGKKARLKEWRRGVFGNDEGYKGDFADFVRTQLGVNDVTIGREEAVSHPVESQEKSKKKRRRKAKKDVTAET